MLEDVGAVTRRFVKWYPCAITRYTYYIYTGMFDVRKCIVWCCGGIDNQHGHDDGKYDIMSLKMSCG